MARTIRTAGVVGGVAVSTLLDANSSCSVPDARTGGGADVRGFEEGALLAALSAEAVPEALGVGGTRSRFVVGIGARGDADTSSVEPHAVVQRLAGNNFGWALEGGATA